MFIAHAKSGKTYSEGKNVAHWDDLPSSEEITSLQLVLPLDIPSSPNSNIAKKSPPTITISGFSAYYCAIQATADVMSMAGQMIAGQGRITHQVMAGLDTVRGEVLYIEMDVKTADIKIHKFNLEEFKVSPHALRHGVIQ